MIKWFVVSPPLQENGYIRGRVGDLTLFTIEMNPIWKQDNITELEKRLAGEKYLLRPLVGCFSNKTSHELDELKQDAENMVSLLMTNIVNAAKQES